MWEEIRLTPSRARFGRLEPLSGPTTSHLFRDGIGSVTVTSFRKVFTYVSRSEAVGVLLPADEELQRPR